jgi:hypothetical protein
LWNKPCQNEQGPEVIFLHNWFFWFNGIVLKVKQHNPFVDYLSAKVEGYREKIQTMHFNFFLMGILSILNTRATGI